jgi:hypothetical protein
LEAKTCTLGPKLADVADWRVQRLAPVEITDPVSRSATRAFITA